MDTSVFLEKMAALINEYESDNGNSAESIIDLKLKIGGNQYVFNGEKIVCTRLYN